MVMKTNLETKKIKIKVLRIETKSIARLERITSNMKKIRLYLIDYHHDMTFFVAKCIKIFDLSKSK